MIKQYTPAEQHILDHINSEMQTEFADDASGHDWWHLYRVVQMARHLAKQEKTNVDGFVVEAAALLHDLEDWKFHQAGETSSQKARSLLTDLQTNPDQVNHICEIIEHVSFKGAQVLTPMSSLEGQIVQDADRLDAIGAVGIARAFAYGGHVGRPLYDPAVKPSTHASFEAYKHSNSPSINHFYEKLLLIKDRLNTDSARSIAQQRHQFMEQFLDEFYAEWEGQK